MIKPFLQRVTVRLQGQFISLAILALLAGCTGDISDLRNRIAAEKEKPPPGIEPIPELRPVPTFIYNAQELRDPFARVVEEEELVADTSGPRPIPNRRKEYLESFELDSLLMTGWMRDENTMWALIQDPEGLIHRVQEGNYLGSNDGRILSITETGIGLLELVSDGRDGFLERDASLQIEE